MKPGLSGEDRPFAIIPREGSMAKALNRIKNFYGETHE